MEYKIGNKKVYIFASENEDNKWEAIILEENDKSRVIYHTEFPNMEDARRGCKVAFERKYPNFKNLWKGFFSD